MTKKLVKCNLIIFVINGRDVCLYNSIISGVTSFYYQWCTSNVLIAHIK